MTSPPAAISSSQIFGDKGDDTIRFGDSATADVLSGALIQANAGNDSMTISGRLLTSTIRGGAGNDVLSLALGSTTGDNDILTLVSVMLETTTSLAQSLAEPSR